jgi:hypothetical protein
VSTPVGYAFLSRLGQDSWPAPTYSHQNWRYDHLDAVAASYVVCLRDGSLPVGGRVSTPDTR